MVLPWIIGKILQRRHIRMRKPRRYIPDELRWYISLDKEPRRPWGNIAAGAMGAIVHGVGAPPLNGLPSTVIDIDRKALVSLYL